MFEIDVPRAKAVAAHLLKIHRETGIFGIRQMPEDLAPPGAETGSEDHMRFITLTVSIDYMRDADQLWDAARRTYKDPATRYLFDPAQVASTGLLKLSRDMQRHNLAKKTNQDPATWQQVSTTIAARFNGTVANLIDASGHDAPRLLELIRSPRYSSGFPFLKGAKIGPLWVRMLHDNCLVDFHGLDRIPVPVDVHTAQATLQIGCVRPISKSGQMADLTDAVHKVWRRALLGSPDGSYPLQLDEPLWILSRNGCRKTQLWPCEFRLRCPAANYCQPDRVRLTVAGMTTSGKAEWTVTS